MGALNIRVREPGVEATIYIKGGWTDTASKDEVGRLLTEAYAAAMQRIMREANA